MHKFSKFFLCAVLALSSFSAFAAPPPPIPPGSLSALQTCVHDNSSAIYTATSSSIPAALIPALEKGSSLAIRICNDFDHNAHYYVRTIARSQDGVCELFEDEIFAGDQSELVALRRIHGEGNSIIRLSGFSRRVPPDWSSKGYRYVADQTMMAQLAGEPCPDGSDKSYIPMGNISPGLFKAAMQAFADVKSSDTGFARIFTGMPNAGVPDPRRVLSGTSVTDMRCSNEGCFAGLNNGGFAKFDLRDGHIVITSVYPYMD